MNEVDTDPGPTFQQVGLAVAMGPAVLVRQDTTLREIARIMLERHVDSVVVARADGAVRGVVTDRALTLNERHLRLAAIQLPRLNGHWVTSCNAVDAACVAATTMTAEEVMDIRLTTANVVEPIGTVVERMVRRDAEYTLVLQDGDVVGLLGRRDLLRLVAGPVESHSVSPPNGGSVHIPTAHLAPNGGWLPLWGWFPQVQIRRKSPVDDGPV